VGSDLSVTCLLDAPPPQQHLAHRDECIDVLRLCLERFTGVTFGSIQLALPEVVFPQTGQGVWVVGIESERRLQRSECFTRPGFEPKQKRPCQVVAGLLGFDFDGSREVLVRQNELSLGDVHASESLVRRARLHVELDANPGLVVSGDQAIFPQQHHGKK
jgi:hypothetical protein